MTCLGLIGKIQFFRITSFDLAEELLPNAIFTNINDYGLDFGWNQSKILEFPSELVLLCNQHAYAAR